MNIDKHSMGYGTHCMSHKSKIVSITFKYLQNALALDFESLQWNFNRVCLTDENLGNSKWHLMSLVHQIIVMLKIKWTYIGTSHYYYALILFARCFFSLVEQLSKYT